MDSRISWEKQVCSQLLFLLTTQLLYITKFITCSEDSKRISIFKDVIHDVFKRNFFSFKIFSIKIIVVSSLLCLVHIGVDLPLTHYCMRAGYICLCYKMIKDSTFAVIMDFWVAQQFACLAIYMFPCFVTFLYITLMLC